MFKGDFRVFVSVKDRQESKKRTNNRVSTPLKSVVTQSSNLLASGRQAGVFTRGKMNCPETEIESIRRS